MKHKNPVRPFILCSLFIVHCSLTIVLCSLLFTACRQSGAYTITVSQPAEGGRIKIQIGNGAYSYDSSQAAQGEKVTASAVALNGYSFAAFIPKGVQFDPGSGETRTFTMPANNVTLAAAFNEAAPVISISSQPQDSAIIVGDALYLWVTASLSVAGDLHYHWYMADNSAMAGEMPVGDNTELLYLPDMPNGDHYFNCEISSSLAPTVTSDTALVSVGLPAPRPGFVYTKAHDGLGVYFNDSNPNGNDFFAAWVGLDIKYAEEFMYCWGWGAYSSPQDIRATYWGPWVQAKPGRQLILTVPPFPDSLFPESSGTGKANDPLARTVYQAAAAGDYNQYYKQLGQILVDYGLANTIIRFGHEMNGDWYAWSIRVPTDTSSSSETIREEKQANYAAAFRQFVDTLRSIPGSNFRFCWNPNTCDSSVPDAVGMLERSYPGNDYVDYIAFDQYDWYIPPYASTPAYFTSADENFRRAIQMEAWNNMVNYPAGMNWFAAFAKQQGKPLAIPEWGVWYRDESEGSDWNQAGGDNPYFIGQMFNWINDNDVAFNSYFMYGDSNLLDTVKFPLSNAEFLDLWNPYGVTTVTPALPPRNLPSGYNVASLKMARDAVLGSNNMSLLGDPWAFSQRILASMWPLPPYKNDTSITFTNCPESAGFALAYRLTLASLGNPLNNMFVSLYINGTFIQEVRVPAMGRGDGDSYGYLEFSNYIPQGTSIMFRADANDYNMNNTANGYGQPVWNSICFDYVIFK